MNENKVKKIVNALREDAEWAHANEWETPIMLGDNLCEAADLIENLYTYLGQNHKHDMPVYKECVSYNGYVCRGMTEEEHNVQKLYYELYFENIRLNDKLKKAKHELEMIQHDFGDFNARLNAGEDLMACEYCKKNFGECSLNCIKEFEWRGISN